MIRNLLCEETIVRRKLPENIHEEDIKFFIPDLEHGTFPLFEDLINNALITVDSVVYHKGRLVKDSLLGPHHIKWFPYSYYLLQRILKKRISPKNHEPFVLCYNYWGEGYFHWITETLPRLYCVKSKLKNAHVLLPQCWNNIYDRNSAILRTLKPVEKKISSPSFYEQSLAPFEIDKFYYIPVDSCLAVEKLLLVSQPAPTGNYNVELMKQVRSLYHSYYIKEEDQSHYPKRIYVSRKKASRRKIVNENDVISLVSKYGFKVVYFEDISFEEQVRHAFFSEHIISLHGGGLTNVLFMKPGARALELLVLDDTHTNLCYFSLAHAVDVKYYYQLCKKTDESLSVQDADVHVDLHKLELNLQLFVA